MTTIRFTSAAGKGRETSPIIALFVLAGITFSHVRIGKSAGFESFGAPLVGRNGTDSGAARRSICTLRSSNRIYGQSAFVVNIRAIGVPSSPRTTKALCVPRETGLSTVAQPNRILVATIMNRWRHEVIPIFSVDMNTLIGKARVLNRARQSGSARS